MLLVEAHVQSEEAEGAVRAVGFALRGEVWTPRDVAAEMEEGPADAGPGGGPEAA